MLTPRQSDILKKVVESYIASGEPVGSLSLRQRFRMDLSAASIRHAMAELEELGLLHRVHHSSGRAPTEEGLRVYVDALARVSSLAPQERESILAACEAGRPDPDRMLVEAGRVVAALCANASLVRPLGLGGVTLRGIRFIRLDRTRAGTTRIMALLVAVTGRIDSRIFDMEGALSQTDLDHHGVTLSRLVDGVTPLEARQRLRMAVDQGERDLRLLCGNLLAAPVFGTPGEELIVNGRMHLLPAFGTEHATALVLRRTHEAMLLIEEKRRLSRLLDLCLETPGVRLFIGAGAALGDGCAVVASSFTGPASTSPGAIGVLGPTRLDYAHVIPLVEFTAKVLSARLADAETPL
ncbi:MAG: heat-inducible transcription repressor HrcA [Magnetococcales bacterium]|nr:heat-inducible transcription repressor HrcA [Magnetococcales bacterium]